MSTYGFGTLVRFKATFKNLETNALADPTDAKLRVQIFPGEVVEFTYLNSQVIRDDVGLYHYDYAPPIAGNGNYSWEGTGSVKVGGGKVPITISDNLFAP